MRSHWKDNIAVNQLSNIVPQTLKSNEGVWQGFENYVKTFLTKGRGKNRKFFNKEVFVIAGTHDMKAVELTAKGTPGTDSLSNQTSVKIPKFLWQVILVVNQSGLKPDEITEDNAYAIGFWMPNDIANDDTEGSRKSNWKQKDSTNQNYTYIKSVDFIESKTGYDFFSYIRKSVQDVIEANQEIRESENIPDAAPLLADGFLNLEKDGTSVSSGIKTLGSPYTLLPNSSIWHNSIAEGSIFDISKTDSIPQIGIAEISIPKSRFTENSASEISIAEVSTIKTTLAHLDLTQVGVNQGSIIETGLISPSSTQISTIKDTFSQINSFHVSSFEISPPEIGIAQVSTLQNSSFQIGSTQISPAQVIKTKIQTNFNEIKESSKVSLSSSVPFQEFFNIHNLPVASTNKYKDNLLNFWQTFTNPTNPFNLTFQITDLPTGQLAEAVITQFDQYGRPNGGTLLIDHNANGIGWYIDPTPFDHSEFSQPLTDTAFRATPSSPVAGKYDLLTTILHEMGHLAGFIDGYSGFDNHIQTINNTPQFLSDNTKATLTPDLSHLDPKHYPYDLMNPTLTPGVRKLPSLIDIAILNTIRSLVEESSGENVKLNAPLDGAPLIAILNGNFNETNSTDKDYGWSTRGTTAILNGQAILSEDKRLNSNFSQTFIVPQAAKYLQFTLLDTTLGTSPLDPPDAFEVALLDTNTLTSLVSTATGLTSTDSLLNIQHDGKAYFSPQVTVPLTATPSHINSLHSPTTYTVDISSIAPGTLATLYFDLLGFGELDSQVILDNIVIVSDEQFAPIANNDSATTDQGKPVAIALLLY